MACIHISSFVGQLWRGKVLRGASVSLIVRFAGLGLGFLQAVLIARTLGPEGYGLVAIAISIAILCATFALFGLGGYSVREISRLHIRKEYGAIIGFILWSSLFVLLLSLVGGAFISGFSYAQFVLSGGRLTELSWGIALVPLMALLILFRGLSQGLGQVLDAQAPAELVRPFIVTLVLGYFFISTVPITTVGFMALLVAANVLAFAVAVTTLFRKIKKKGLFVPRTMACMEWFRGSVPFFGIAIVGTLQVEINTLLLGWLAGAEETGLFQPILRLAPFMLIAVQAVYLPLEPRVSELWEQQETQRLSHIARLTTIATTVAAIATCGVVLFASPWLLSAFGGAFTANIAALTWIAAAQIFNAACGPTAVLLAMSGNQIYSLYSLLASLATNLVLGLIFIPAYGGYGAAMAMAGSIVVWNILMLLAVQKRLGFDPSFLGVIFKKALLNRC